MFSKTQIYLLLNLQGLKYRFIDRLYKVLSTKAKFIFFLIYFYRVQLGKLEDFIKTSCLASLSFIGDDEEGQGICVVSF